VRGATSSSIAAIRHRARAGFIGALVVALVLGVATIVLNTTASSTYAITPGLVLRVDPQLRGIRIPPPLQDGGVDMVDVRLEQLTNLGALIERWSGSSSLVSAADLGLTGGANLATYQREDRRLMEQSVQMAVRAAREELRVRFHRGLGGDVTVAHGNIGGPSAGLAQGLAIVDRVLGGSLSGGRIIVASGTLAASGAVGPVGGLSAKLDAVERSRATIFLVPRSELGAVVAQRPHAVTVIGVATLDGAVSALEAR